MFWLIINNQKSKGLDKDNYDYYKAVHSSVGVCACALMIQFSETWVNC